MFHRGRRKLPEVMRHNGELELGCGWSGFVLSHASPAAAGEECGIQIRDLDTVNHDRLGNLPLLLALD